MARKSAAQVAQEKLKLDRIQAAMTPLVGIPAFVEFMQLIKDLKDEAVANSVSFETSASERNSLVSKGEVLSYLNIIQTYEGELEQQEAQIRAAQQETNG
jgi:hypothetical protein